MKPEADHLAVIPAAVRPIIEAASRAVGSVAPKAEQLACQSRKPRSPSMMWKLVRYAVDGGTQLCIVGVQNQQTRWRDYGGDAELHIGDSRKIVYAVLAEVIGAHVGDHRTKRT